MRTHRIERLLTGTAAKTRMRGRPAARGGIGRVAAITAALLTVFSTALGAEPPSLSVDEAVQAALKSDPGVESSTWDWLASEAKAASAQWRMMPSLSLTGSYQKLSDLPAYSLQMPNPINPSLPPIEFALPASLTDIWTFSVNMQYPIFAGLRVREAAALAGQQAQGKAIAAEMVKRSLVFEVRRAYWEALRASRNVATLQKNLELADLSQKVSSQQEAQGTATRADQLTAEARTTQAKMDLGDAVSAEERAYMVLASLTGNGPLRLHLAPDGTGADMPFTLVSNPQDAGIPSDLDEEALVSQALEKRPETRASVLSLQAAERSLRLSQASLYPTLSLTGNFTYADPNQRVAFQTDPTVFTRTWSVGVALGYDLGGLPAAIADADAQAKAAKKAAADAEDQRNTVELDVRTCVLNLERARRDLSLVSWMVDQAAEGLRVAQQKQEAGTVNDLDVLTAQLAVLRSDFNVTNRQIDVQIAIADLMRATAAEEIR